MRIFLLINFIFLNLALQAEDKINYKKDVFPILKQNCFKCHYDKKIKGEFSFISKESILKGGKTGKDKDVIPGNSKDSIMIKLILSKDVDEYMPPKGNRLSETEVEILKKWIDQNLPMDEPEKKPDEKVEKKPDEKKDENPDKEKK